MRARQFGLAHNPEVSPNWARAMDTTPQSAPPNPPATKRRASHDRDLEIARRVDWRYLLPDPRLREVTFIGKPEGILLEALHLFSERLAVITPSAERTQMAVGNSDVAVVRSRERVAIALASSALRTGGYLYWEVEPSRWRLSLRNNLGALRGLGFDEIRVYWCRPNFEDCLEMVPLRKSSVLAFVLSRNFGGMRRWMWRAVARLFARTGLLAWLMPCRSVVARKGG